jgi:hypothetical protein
MSTTDRELEAHLTTNAPRLHGTAPLETRSHSTLIAEFDQA